MRKYYIKTFGCAMNQADSEKINMILLQSGFIKSNIWQDSDLIIFNTCSVRQKWEDRVFWYINEIIKKRKEIIKQELKLQILSNNNTPELIIWITGCMVRKTWLNEKYLWEKLIRKRARKIEYITWDKWIYNNDDKLFPRSKWLDFTLRIEEIKHLPHILSEIYYENIWIDYKFDNYLKLRQLRDNKSIASIIIQTWCDNYCSYCIVPYTRWKELSRPQNEILEEIKEAVEKWAIEIVLIWQNVNSYWKQFLDKKFWDDKKGKWIKNKKIISPFRELLNEINKIKWIDRIRFTSSNPHDMTPDILDAHFELNKTCNYLHFALQSWSDEMLKKMNRKHTYNEFKKMVKYLRTKDPLFSISTDIIVWFSWETEYMFNQTLKAVEECEIDFVYNARYSVRKWTIASKLYLDDISDTIKAERWHKINNLLKKNVINRSKLMIWKTEPILILWKKDWKYFWRTRNYKEVHFKSDKKIEIWNIIQVKLEKVDGFIINWSEI